VTPNPPAELQTDVGTVNQAVIDALLTRRWADLERLVPRSRAEDPSPDVRDELYRVE